MAPAMGLNEPEVPSATDATAADGLDNVRVAAEQDHLQDTGNEEGRVSDPGEPERNDNVLERHDNGPGGSLPAVSADEDDPFDDDSEDDVDDDDFVARGPPNAGPTGVAQSSRPARPQRPVVGGQGNALPAAAAAQSGVRTGTASGQPVGGASGGSA